MPPDPDSWWSISASELYDMLHRVEAGEKAAIVYAEAYAKARRIQSDDDN